MKNTENAESKYILTYAKTKFFPLHTIAADIHIEDIAHKVCLVYHIRRNLLDVFKEIDIYRRTGHFEGSLKITAEFLKDFFG